MHGTHSFICTYLTIIRIHHVNAKALPSNNITFGTYHTDWDNLCFASTCEQIGMWVKPACEGATGRERNVTPLGIQQYVKQVKNTSIGR
jgi:hypothetical protein